MLLDAELDAGHDSHYMVEAQVRRPKPMLALDAIIHARISPCCFSVRLTAAQILACPFPNCPPDWTIRFLAARASGHATKSQWRCTTNRITPGSLARWQQRSGTMFSGFRFPCFRRSDTLPRPIQALLPAARSPRPMQLQPADRAAGPCFEQQSRKSCPISFIQPCCFSVKPDDSCARLDSPRG